MTVIASRPAALGFARGRAALHEGPMRHGVEAVLALAIAATLARILFLTFAPLPPLPAVGVAEPALALQTAHPFQKI